MSEGNLELVRESVEALGRAFEAYFRAPRSIAEAIDAGDWPEWEEALRYIHPEIEWQTVFLATTVHGRGAAARLWDDYLVWASDYRLKVEELESLGGDRVFAVLELTGRDKRTGREMTSRFYDIFTVREGMIGRLEEYTSRAEALGDNVDRLRAFWNAWTPSAEIDMSILDADVIYEDTTLPDHIGEVYRGYEGVARATERWLEAYESMTIELERIMGSGDRLVSVHHVRTKASYTGIEERGPLAYVWTFRDGKVIHFRSYRDPDEAVKNAELSE